MAAQTGRTAGNGEPGGPWESRLARAHPEQFGLGDHRRVAITSGGTIQLGSTGSDGIQGLQALTVTSAATARPGAILQLTPTADGQHLLVPSNQVVVQTSSGDVQTYQIRPSPGTNSVPQTNRAGEATLKREIRLMKNR
ncbi:cyclic AMP-responsive element-binding protein 1-like [Rhincodon typus]|uniref:cyclic AMP-responsive element-binding protein 1-like n=1 Tax=Rhincodon typus TaxID=259920 RepID=UPI00202FDF69|nr:cyclic AMP-responsive element-binding protein 1-like [Rhincodon typus]